jgi:hypothetical protein
MNQARLRELLHYDANTGVFTWRVSRGNRRVGDRAGSRDDRGYIRLVVDSTSYCAHRLAWLYVTGGMPPCPIDHIDRNKSNNRLQNLRCLTDGENKQNVGLRADNVSGHKGVSWLMGQHKWRATIRVNNVQIHLGSFTQKESAVQAYAAAAAKYHTHNPMAQK